MNAVITDSRPAIRTPTNQHLLKSGPSKIRICNAQAYDIQYHESVEDSIERMDNDGFVVFRNLLDADGVKRLRQLMDEIGGPNEDFKNRGHYGKTSDADMEAGSINKHIGCPFAINPDFLDYIDMEPAIDIIRAIHGPGTHATGGSVWITGPGRYPMGLHVDYQPFGLPEDIAKDPRVKIPIMSSTLHFYLNDMYQELGPTLLVPGSHRAGRAPNGETHWNGKEAQGLECHAGDAMLFRSDLWHGALPNCSGENRYMLQVHYGTPYIASSYTDIKRRRELSDETVERATEQQRQLLGEPEAGAPGSYLVDSFIREQDKQEGVFFA